MRIAVVSSDEKVINQHFGKASRFLIFDVEDKVKFVEERKNKPICGTAEDGHSEDALESSISLIKDCNIVLCSRIGNLADKELKKHGIRCLETPFFIGDTLRDVKHYIDLEDKERSDCECH